jgi:hypothetical protein
MLTADEWVGVFGSTGSIADAAVNEGDDVEESGRDLATASVERKTKACSKGL